MSLALSPHVFVVNVVQKNMVGLTVRGAAQLASFKDFSESRDLRRTRGLPRQSYLSRRSSQCSRELAWGRWFRELDWLAKAAK